MTKTEEYLLMLVKRTIKQIDGLSSDADGISHQDTDRISDDLEIDIGIRRGCEDKATLEEIVEDYYNQ
jgi:hypothetical protein